MKKNEFVKNYLGGGTTINACMGVVMLTVALIYSKITLIMVNEEKKNPEIHHDLAVIGELDHWDYFTTIYFTFQTVSTIGFGDEFIYSPEKGTMSFIKPIFIILFTAFLIALFAHIFGKIQRRMDKKAAKKSVESSIALQGMSKSVKKASQAVNHKMLFGSDEPSEILKRLQALRDENGQNDGFDAMLMGRHRVLANKIHEEGDGTDNSQPSDSQPSSSINTVI
ncbi:uncharacterized protein LOC134815874 [Bolinopsis microptera]|uniref:uncharacterized protein LOC134815874 n=1 Tax=Bolinopsis microptera TaxID=2820187 RepID=UPI00307ACFD1